VLQLSGEERIASVRHLSPLMELSSVEDKESVFDLSVQDHRGNQYVVEMQCLNHRALAERMLYYAARRYGEQLRPGMRYTSLRPVVLVIFTGFELFKEIEVWQEWFDLRGRESGVVLTPQLRVVLIQLPKFHRVPMEAERLGEQWLCFLKEGSNVSTEVLEKWVTPELRKAREELEKLAGDEKMRHRYEARARYVEVWSTRLHSSYLDGLDKGRQEGLDKGRQEGLDKGRQEGLDKGRQEGLDKGREEGLRTALCETYQARFGEVPEKLRVKIQGTKDLSLLREWLALFATAPEDELQAQLAEPE